MAYRTKGPMPIGDRSKRAANRRTKALMAATECTAGHPYVEGSHRVTTTASGQARRICEVCERHQWDLRSAQLHEYVSHAPAPEILAVIEATCKAMAAGYAFEEIATAVAGAREAWTGPATPDLTKPVYRVACPLCGAAPRSPCVIISTSLWRPVGSPVQHAHTARTRESHVIR